MKSIAYVGMDVHPGHIDLAMVGSVPDPRLAGQLGMDFAAERDRVIERRRLGNEKGALQRYFRSRQPEYDLRCCYEASSCGYVVHRWLKDVGIACEVIAPSRTPRRPGDRTKTDRLDALKLARLHRAGELTPVHVPTPEEESERSLVRYRQGLVYDCTRVKNRILKVLDRHGIQYTEGKSSFSQKHWRFLRRQEFPGEEGYTFREYLSMLEYLQVRLAEADRRVLALAQSDRYAAKVGKLCCLRGIAELSGMVLQTETIDFSRFRSAPDLMGYWGLGVCEESSGEERRQGGITKTGNNHCRWVMVEMAWHYEHPPAMSEALKKRMEGQPVEVVAHALKAQVRLHHKFWKVVKSTGCRQKAAVAVAREGTGFVWAIMTDRCGTGASGPA